MAGAVTFFVSLLLATALRAGPSVVVIPDATVYVSPDQRPLTHTTVVITGSTITTVGPAAAVPIPPGATVIQCVACVVMAGFWNTHVHFEQPLFSAQLPADTLAARMQAMLTRYGFTTVIDLGSYIVNTDSLRRRVESGEVAGPQILTAGGALFPPHGVPFYLINTLPSDVVSHLATPSTPDSAAGIVDYTLRSGADVIKLYTGSWISRGTVRAMPKPVARRAVAEAHRRHRLVFSHCSNLAGARVALDAGVDVMAHALDDTSGVDSTLFRRMVVHHMAMIPTLSLFADDVGLAAIIREVTTFRAYGGQLLFGTDVGYTHEYDPSREYELLARAGLDVSDVLRMLTTAPAQEMGLDQTRGHVEEGMRADLTILNADPSIDLTAFARVRYTIRGGRVIFAGS
jgi:imidazolonepropionase-like amidohydrolase